MSILWKMPSYREMPMNAAYAGSTAIHHGILGNDSLQYIKRLV